MECESCREVLSAALDNEADPVRLQRAEGHLEDCAGCRAFREHIQELHRRVRIAPAEDVPDLTTPILSAVDAEGPTEPERVRLGSARLVLAVVGALQLAFAVPVLLGVTVAGSPHLARELGAFGVALALGLLVAAWQPDRAWGLLPMVGSLGAVLFGGAVVDLLTGRVGLVAESSHLLQLAGVAVLWLVARDVSGAAVGSPG